MTVDGINILTTYNLRLETVKDHASLPARKRILQEPAFTASDIKTEERQIIVSLFGEFASRAVAASVVNALRVIMITSTKHTISIPAHQVSVTGVFKQGAKVETYGTSIHITITITVTDD